VNGHPVSGAYERLPIASQLDLVRHLGLASYRVDLYGTDAIDRFAALVDAARARGIAILPILIPDPMKAANEAAAYREGYAMAEAFARRFRGELHVWELGNEYEVAVGVTGDGSDPSHFNDVRYAKARGAIRGMLDGVRAGDHAARRMIGAGGWCHYGFLRRLADDGVSWDITGEHWYSNEGDIEAAGCGCGVMAVIRACRTNVLEVLHRWGKPIWITEFNNNSPEERAGQAGAEWLVRTMRRWDAMASRYDIEAAQIYELLDVPQLNDRNAASFGLAFADGRVKPAAEAVRTYLAQRKAR
jgi:hypothetical protein